MSPGAVVYFTIGVLLAEWALVLPEVELRKVEPLGYLGVVFLWPLAFLIVFARAIRRE